jgi:hypothetical protein
MESLELLEGHGQALAGDVLRVGANYVDFSMNRKSKMSLSSFLVRLLASR